MRILVCWLAIAVAVQAQQYVFHAYRQAEGLKSLSVNAITIDRFGFLWVATENGVYRFLGSSFQHFGWEQGIGDPEISDVVADPDGTLWVGTKENLYRWDGQRFSPAGKNAIPILDVQNMAVEDASHLLVVNKHRLYRLQHDNAGGIISWTPAFPDRMVVSIPELNQISRVTVVREGARRRIWLACDNELVSVSSDRIGGVMKPGDGTVTKWGKEQGLVEEHWAGVLLDRAGTLWAAGRDHIMVLPKGATRFVDRSLPGSDPGNPYGHAPLVEDREGRVLVVADEGVARWEGASWRLIGRASGLLRSSRIRGLAFDASGDLWLGGAGGGVYDWTGYEDWEGWDDERNLISSGIRAIAPSHDGRIYLGTENGPAWVDPRDGSEGRLFASSRWNFGEVSAIGPNRDGSVWAGTFAGDILRINPTSGHTEQIAMLPAFIYTALDDSAGRLFFATSGGIWMREAGKATPRHVAAVDALLGDSKDVVAGCEAPGGSDWFLTKNRFLRLKDGVWTQPPVDGLPKLHGSLIALACGFDGSLWATGQDAGTWRLMPAGDRMRAWQLQLPTELSALTPLAIAVDRHGSVWLGSDQGVIAWNGQTWRRLTQESGLIWNDVNQSSLVAAADGTLWIGTTGGLSHLLHPQHVFDTVPLAVSLTGIWRGGVVYSGAGRITLPWATQPLHFQISTPSIRNRSELVFKYRMVGLQPDWTESRDGLATFSALPPGKYIFEAMASNSNLNAHSVPIKLEVRISPPWWRSYWFYCLCGLALLFLAMFAARLYKWRVLERSRELEILVHERTRELEISREQLHIQATHDGLTGMLNRVAILQTLSAEMDRAEREHRTIVVAMVDLDHFKRINDVHGHLAGDEALRWFAAAVRKVIRGYDHAGRYGGEEFLLVLTEIPREAIEQRLSRLHASISNLHVSAQGVQFRIDCTMGATVFDPSRGSVSVESLLAIADQALYSAKDEGRNRIVFRRADYSESQQKPDDQLSSPL
jgi:diguanylate cyclase (GGDEF)-like protein